MMPAEITIISHHFKISSKTKKITRKEYSNFVTDKTQTNTHSLLSIY